MWVHTCNPSPQQAGADDQEFKVIPQLHKELKASLGYRKPSLSLSPASFSPYRPPQVRPAQPGSYHCVTVSKDVSYKWN